MRLHLIEHFVGQLPLGLVPAVHQGDHVVKHLYLASQRIWDLEARGTLLRSKSLKFRSCAASNGNAIDPHRMPMALKTRPQTRFESWLALSHSCPTTIPAGDSAKR